MMLQLKGVTAGYGAGPILTDLEFEVDEGQVAVLLGANGAGKTTTLRVVSNMLPSSGEILFDGKPTRGLRTERLLQLGLAHVPEGRGVFADLTVRENLLVGAHRRRDHAQVAGDVQRWLEQFPNLAARVNERAGSLSGGEQQMLALARAMMARPRLLVMDEPSLGLAPLTVRTLFDVLAEINQRDRLTMVIVEQNAELALSIAHRGYVLERGHISLAGRADELRSNDAVRLAYLGT